MSQLIITCQHVRWNGARISDFEINGIKAELCDRCVPDCMKFLEQMREDSKAK